MTPAFAAICWLKRQMSLPSKVRISCLVNSEVDAFSPMEVRSLSRWSELMSIMCCTSSHTRSASFMTGSSMTDGEGDDEEADEQDILCG